MAQGYRFVLLLLTCAGLASLNYFFLWRLPSTSDPNDVLGAEVQRQARQQGESETTLLPRCPVPNFDLQAIQKHLPEHLQNMSRPTLLGSWEYYTNISHENSAMATRVRNHTADPIPVEEGNIPHRLIFTHKKNLFSCENSASNSTSAPIYNLAENAKATVNTYARIWNDLEYVFLTDDDCIEAIKEVFPALLLFFYNPKLEGMYKADICRAAYLYLHGGYYFDVDVLVVRPYVAPKGTTFVTVKGDGYPAHGFFQAFLAVVPGHPIVNKSLTIMLDYLTKGNGYSYYLGPMALMEAWIQIDNITNATTAQDKNGVHLMSEVNLNELSNALPYKRILSYLLKGEDYLTMTQRVPLSFGDRCQFSSGVCNVLVVDEHDETIYFYSRILGTRWCGKKVRTNCTTHEMIMERVKKSK